MALTPEQNLQIAAAYEKAATDYRVPPQHRKAFARKAKSFRRLALLGMRLEMLGRRPAADTTALRSPSRGASVLEPRV